jgi:hypothetical protein
VMAVADRLVIARRLEDGMSYYIATEKPSGWVNPVKVKCSGCGANLFVNPNMVKTMSGWECPHCHKRH